MVGDSGSGKTTLMKLPGALDIPDSGNVSKAQYAAMQAYDDVLAVSSYIHLGFLEEDVQDEIVEVQYSEEQMTEWMYYGQWELRQIYGMLSDEGDIICCRRGWERLRR